MNDPSNLNECEWLKERAVKSRFALLCLDGISWEYIYSSNAPCLKEMKRIGTSLTCRSMVPTVTNVNNASIVTGEFPITHGISGNYYYDRSGKTETYMDSPRFLTYPTLFEKVAAHDCRTLFLTVKDKLRRLLSRGATTSFSVEKPSPWIVKQIGKPPDIYSAHASLWLLDAAICMLRRKKYDVTYVSTTDFVPHKHSPKSTEAREFVEGIDERIGTLINEGCVTGVTADHGMNDKRLNVDLAKTLSEAGLESNVVPIIRDEHIIHHQNLGGSVYIYLKEGLDKALDILRDVEGAEAVLTREQAERTYLLPPDRIGDIFVLGDAFTTFGPVSKGCCEDVSIRSHGSLHELHVPLMTSREMKATASSFNKDAFRILLQDA